MVNDFRIRNVIMQVWNLRRLFVYGKTILFMTCKSLLFPVKIGFQLGYVDIVDLIIIGIVGLIA